MHFIQDESLYRQDAWVLLVEASTCRGVLRCTVLAIPFLATNMKFASSVQMRQSGTQEGRWLSLMSTVVNSSVSDSIVEASRSVPVEIDGSLMWR